MVGEEKWKVETGDWKLETGNWKLDWKLETKPQKIEQGTLIVEVGRDGKGKGHSLTALVARYRPPTYGGQAADAKVVRSNFSVPSSLSVPSVARSF